MTRSLAIATILGLATALAFAQKDGDRIPKGSKVFIDATEEFQYKFAEMLQRHQVPLEVVTERKDADFVIQGAREQHTKGWKLGINNMDSASIEMVNTHTDTVIYSDTAKTRYKGDHIDVIEHLVKQLKKHLDKQEKGKG